MTGSTRIAGALAALVAVALLATMNARAQETPPPGGTAGQPTAPAPLSPGEARSLAGEIAAGLGLPQGGNVNGIHWEEAGGLFSRADVEFVVRYNAACQWLRAFADQRQRPEALDVLRSAPDWPRFSGTEIGAHAAEVATDAGDGALDRVAASHVGVCRDAAAIERGYAMRRGMAPTR